MAEPQGYRTAEGEDAIDLREMLAVFRQRAGAAVHRVLALAIPVFISNELNAITLAVDKIMASSLPEGSVAALNYGALVFNMLWALIAAILTQYLFPKLSQSAAAGNADTWRGQVRTGIVVISLLGAPITLGGLLYSRPVIELIYERGAFNAASSDVTQICFFWYMVGLAFQMIIVFLTTVFYSRENTKTPVMLASICAGVNVVGNLILVRVMGIGGIALSTSIAFFVNAMLLILALRRRGKTSAQDASGSAPAPDVLSASAPAPMFGKSFAVRTIKIVCAAAASVAASRPVYGFAATRTGAATGASLAGLASLLLAVLVAAAVYYALLRLLRVEEVKMLRKLLPHRKR
jgi:putative peptidoglycan lipid II flippase